MDQSYLHMMMKVRHLDHPYSIREVRFTRQFRTPDGIARRVLHARYYAPHKFVHPHEDFLDCYDYSQSIPIHYPMSSSFSAWTEGTHPCSLEKPRHHPGQCHR